MMRLRPEKLSFTDNNELKIPNCGWLIYGACWQQDSTETCLSLSSLITLALPDYKTYPLGRWKPCQRPRNTANKTT